MALDPRFKKLAAKAQRKIKADVQEIGAGSGDSNGVPRVNLSAGNTWFRFYYDEGSNSLIRRVYMHWVNKKTVPCLGEDCPFCDVSNQAVSELGRDTAWKLGFSKSMQAIMYGVILKVDYQNKYMKIDEPCLICLKSSIAKAVLQFLDGDLDQISLARQLDPTNPAFPVKIRYSAGTGKTNQSGNINVSLDTGGKRVTIPEFPEEFPSLTDVWMPENASMDDKDIVNTVRAMRKLIEKNSDVVDPNKGDDDEDDNEYSSGGSSVDEDEDEGTFARHAKRVGRRKRVFGGGR